MSLRESRREHFKSRVTLLADHAEDTMDSDDVDQVREEIIAWYDAAVVRAEEQDREVAAQMEAAVARADTLTRALRDIMDVHMGTMACWRASTIAEEIARAALSSTPEGDAE